MPGTGKTFEVSLVTPDGAAYEGEAEMLIVPGQIGEIGVLARHAPLIATLKAGSTRIHPGGDADVLEFATGPGFFQVIHDRAIALVDDAVAAAEIDDVRGAGAARGGSGRARGDRPRRVDGRPLAGRAAHPPRREPARGRRPRVMPPRRRPRRGRARRRGRPGGCSRSARSREPATRRLHGRG